MSALESECFGMFHSSHTEQYYFDLKAAMAHVASTQMNRVSVSVSECSE